ncbi:hypothetical protein AMJ44_02920 [candidate division WOR-1 bacterium DG_54_3]|uniref:Uroporphyrinogen decarboxylase (URO-D) domain-containing protein n=1 Tax=candidate division WOR-1 bacterium DG_54_3 TaxID=1703775 RepID=A0A0S7Y5J8_UNCSA|nr:MAG: hypothetical protein AMJ44_02920 [candidate division WOR-1 bacterium DG_54_3]
MYYKSDWEQAKKRFLAFWNNEIIDRCCVAVYASRKTSRMPPFPELQWGPWLEDLEKFSDDDTESIRKWWTDPEENYKRMITWFENTYFGGEAIPATYVNWGAMAMAAFYGSNPVFKKTSVWYPPVIENWEGWEWKLEPKTDKYWQQIFSITDYLLERSDGKYFVGTPEVGSAGDLLSLMRGMDKLCMDLIDNPEQVKKAISVLGDTWVKFHEEMYQKTVKANDNGDILAWMSLWAPGRHDQVACDFSTVISPASFKEFFVPEIEKEGGWCEYCTYHLDGPDAMNNHLHTLLGVEQIDNIEWTPGTGCPPTLSPQYIPKYKKIQQAGKRLYLLAKPEEIEPLLSELSAKGLFICTNVDSEEQAKELLKKMENWSKAR